jgi:RNA polymerase sigma-70 factor (ECF subfamily)
MNYKGMSDEELMLLVKNEDDKDAYEELHHRHSGMTLKVCLNSTKNEPVAQELNQEVWMKIWRRRKSFRDDGVFKAWLLVITTSVCLDWIRKNNRTIQVLPREDQTDQAMEEWLERLSKQAEQIYRSTEYGEAVRRAWNRLSAEDQKLLLQADVYEMTQKEMAEERKISIPSLRKRLAQARERYRLNLLEEGIQIVDPQTKVSTTEEETQAQSENSRDQSEEIEN